MAKSVRSTRFDGKPSSNLFRGPTTLQPINYAVAQVVELSQFLKPCTPLQTVLVRNSWIVPIQIWHLWIDEPISFDLSVDRGAMTAHTFGNLVHWHALLVQVRQKLPIR